MFLPPYAFSSLIPETAMSNGLWISGIAPSALGSYNPSVSQLADVAICEVL